MSSWKIFAVFALLVMLAGCGGARVRAGRVTSETVIVTVAPAASGPIAADLGVREVPTVGPTTGLSVLAQGQVALYEHDGFGGREWLVSGDVLGFVETDGLNDIVSSVRVGPGAAVSLYQDVGFAGRRVWIDADAPSLTGSTLGNDAASSARVRASLVAGEVALYEHVGFEGQEWIVRGDAAELTQLSGADEHVSSIRVGPRTSVVLFLDRGFGGASETFAVASVPSLLESALGNDAISSLKVRVR